MSLDSPKGADSSAEFSDLRRYLRVLRNRRWSILAVVAITVAATAAYAYLRVPAYEASSQVVVEPITLGSPQQVVDAFSLETEAAVAQSTEVARLAGERMGSEESPEALAGRVTVTVPTDTLSLLITFSHSDPQVARQGAEAFAEAYLEYRQQQAQEEAEQLAETYEDETAALQAQVAEVNLQLAESPVGSAEFRDAVVLRNLLRTELSTLRARVTVVRTADLDPGEIIVHATQPTSPVGVDNQRLLVIGVLLGLFFGVLFAFFRDRVDERPKSRIDLEEAIGAPVLALVPKVHDGAKRDAARLFTVDDPRSPAAEAFRTLGASVLVMGSERRLSSRQRRSNIKTLLVVSSLDEEGKTTTAANLGAELAQSGKRVLVISADLRKPRLHEFFRLPNERGLTQMLAGDTHDWRNGPGSGVPNLWVLPSGPPVDLPAEALRSDRMRKVLLEASDVMDFVILDGHPLLLVGDSLVLASYVDGVLLVVDAERTSRTAMMQTRGAIEQVGGNLVGAVVNKVEAERLGWEFVAYGYYGPAGIGKEQTSETWGGPPEVRKP
jgi:capsular exopolysaccharide synthesis family protein